MDEQTPGTHRHIEFGSLPQEVRSVLLQFAAEGEIVDIGEQTYRGYKLYEVEVEPTAHQSFRLLVGTNGVILDRTFTGSCRQEPAPGCWG
jgi:hypothetical protein